MASVSVESKDVKGRLTHDRFEISQLVDGTSGAGGALEVIGGNSTHLRSSSRLVATAKTHKASSTGSLTLTKLLQLGIVEGIWTLQLRWRNVDIILVIGNGGTSCISLAAFARRGVELGSGSRSTGEFTNTAVDGWSETVTEGESGSSVGSSSLSEGDSRGSYVTIRHDD